MLKYMTANLLWKKVMTSKHPVRDRIRYVQHEINVVHIQYNCNKISKTVYYDQLEELNSVMNKLKNNSDCK